jgi:uncharacterized protein (TIGR02266 family)
VSSEPSSSEPVRVRLRYAAFETFIDKFAPNVTRGGVFLASRTPRPVGDVFTFEVLLAGGEVALSGEGKVTWVRDFDPAAPQKPHGMGVQFLRLDAPSRDVVNRMLARKAAAVTAAQSGGLRPASPGGAPRRNGLTTTGPLPTVDANVDIAAELGVDEARLRRAMERNWLAPGRAAGELEELEALLRPEQPETVTTTQALAELPRLLETTVRRSTGAFRPLAELLSPEPPPPPREPPAASLSPPGGERE